MELVVDGPAGPRRAYAYTGGKAFDAGLPTIVFVHGAMNDHSVWTLLARWFAHHGHAVLALDLPGHGRSVGPAQDSVEALADWLLRVLDAAGAGEVMLVGHSLGSLVVLEAAARRPVRVKALALIATACPMAVSPALLKTAAETPLLAIEQVNAWSHSGFAAKPAYPGPGTWTHGSSRALMRRMQARDPAQNLFLTDFEACNRYVRGFEAAASISSPVTFILGRHDQMTPPRQAEALATALHARVETLAGGHALMAEAPDAVLAAVRRAVGAAPGAAAGSLAGVASGPAAGAVAAAAAAAATAAAAAALR